MNCEANARAFVDAVTGEHWYEAGGEFYVWGGGAWARSAELTRETLCRRLLQLAAEGGYPVEHVRQVFRSWSSTHRLVVETLVGATIFSGRDAPQGKRIELSWTEFADAMATPREGEKEKEVLPGWSPATFAGSYRNKSNVEFAYAIGLDVDKDVATTIEDVVRCWAGFSALIHTSFSHSADNHKLRVFLEPSRPMTAAEYSRVHEFVRREAEGRGFHVDGSDEAKDASRFWFAPARPPNGLYEFRVLHGAPLSVDAALAAIPAHAVDEFEYEFEERDYHKSESKTNAEGASHLTGMCEELKLLEDGHRHTGIFKIGCRAGELIALGEAFVVTDAPALAAAEAEAKLEETIRAQAWANLDDKLRTLQDGLTRGYSRAAAVLAFAQLPHTDLGNARRFVMHYAQSVRYCPPRKTWLIWDGKRWAWDHRDYAVELAKRTVEHIRVEARLFPAATEDPETGKKRKGPRERLQEHAKKSEAAPRIEALLKLARSEQSITVLPSDLDKDPLLFNCANGTLDLSTGTLRPHSPTDNISMLSPVAYDQNAKKGLWANTIGLITKLDSGLARYLQKLGGLCLTAERKKAFWFCFGPPDGAKSTFIEALQRTMGDYAAAADATTWLKRAHASDNRGDIVRLAGKRLIVTVEFPRVATFDERLVKQFTGGDDVTASDKFEKHIQFTPVAKVMFAANHAPYVDDSDEGMWERCNRLPFTNVIPKHEQKAEVRDLLCDPAIGGPEVLAWMVEGYRLYRAEGLEPPSSVLDSTKQYRTEMDLAGRFVAECCVLEAGREILMRELRDEFDRWREANGEKQCPSGRKFNATLEKLGCRRHKNVNRFWQGIRLRTPDELEDFDGQSSSERSAAQLSNTLRNGVAWSAAAQARIRDHYRVGNDGSNGEGKS